MGVLCESLSVVVPVRVLEERYPGGVAGYRADVPNTSYLTDGELTRVGFLGLGELAAWLDVLAGAGLRTIDQQGRFGDLAVVDDVHGPPLPCPWLRTAVRGGMPVAWLGTGAAAVGLAG